MNKAQIIEKLWVDWDVWECGYNYYELEAMTKAELQDWLNDLVDGLGEPKD